MYYTPTKGTAKHFDSHGHVTMPAPRVNPQESGTDGWDDGVVYDGVPITVATEILQNGRNSAIRERIPF